VIEVKALTCSRGAATLFRDVSFNVAAGEMLALRGPNGSGKTTMLRCVAGLTRADAGEILWNGSSVATQPAAYHANLVYGGHLAGIKDDFNAEENVRVALALRGVRKSDAEVHAAIDEAGLARRRRIPSRRLSAGQRRRIGLARLALDPALLWLLDEPLTALDDEGQALFGALLARHLARGGLALVATHHALPVEGTREWRLGA
jgi:heme exporter protein A